MSLQKNITSRNYLINLYKRIAMIDYTVRKILVPTDFSEHANNALSLAAEIAAETDAERSAVFTRVGFKLTHYPRLWSSRLRSNS